MLIKVKFLKKWEVLMMNCIKKEFLPLNHHWYKLPR